jgi:hypothetical protein
VCKRGRDIGKYTVGGKVGGDPETVETWELLINRSFVITYRGILNLTPNDNLLTAYVYVAYRSKLPDKATVKDMLIELKKNNIDVSQLVEYRTNHCQ